MLVKKRKIKLSALGFLIFLIGSCLIFYDTFNNINKRKNKEKQLEEFYINVPSYIDEKVQAEKNVSSEYIAIIKIPKINLENGLVDPNSKYNDIKYNIQILNGSTMPDQVNGNLILAAHSGTTEISYFRNLDKLQLNDNIFIDYKGREYNYQISNIYDIEKTGEALIIRKKEKTTLTLITCRHNTTKQIVIICELV